MLSLHEVLTNGYNKNKSQQIGDFKLDRDLSNGNQQVYFNEKNGKLHYNVNGTRNLKDWMVDVIAIGGGLKNTKRYKDADRTLKNAKQKYNVDNATISSHSLGGAIAGRIAKKMIKFIHLINIV